MLMGWPPLEASGLTAAATSTLSAKAGAWQASHAATVETPIKARDLHVGDMLVPSKPLLQTDHCREIVELADLVVGMLVANCELRHHGERIVDRHD